MSCPNRTNGRSRFDHEADDLVRSLFSPEDLALSPEEYAARNAHRWACFSFHEYRYRDPVLGVWVRRVGELFFTDGEVERCRREYLSGCEREQIRREEEEEW